MITRFLMCAALAAIALGANAQDAIQGAPIGSAPEETESAKKAPSLDELLGGSKKKSSAESVLAPAAPSQPKPQPNVRERKPKDELARTKDGEFIKLNFTYLGGFPYVLPDPYAPVSDEVPAEQIPAEVQDLSGEEVVIVGYMMPIRSDASGSVSEFVLVRDQSLCCYGVPPMINDWIEVDVDEGVSARFYSDVPIAVFGELEVGEEVEDGYVVSIYRMAASRVVDVQTLIREG